MLENVIPLNEQHLMRLGQEYVRYYHDDRTHIGLGKQTPGARAIEQRTNLLQRNLRQPATRRASSSVYLGTSSVSVADGRLQDSSACDEHGNIPRIWRAAVLLNRDSELGRTSIAKSLPSTPNPFRKR
jgi:hypothetical protein